MHEKLSDYKGEQAIAVLGKCLTPIAECIDDLKESNGAKPIEIAAKLLQNHAHAVLELISAVRDVEVNELQEESGVKLIAYAAKIIADNEFVNAVLEAFPDFFPPQGQTDSSVSTGSATENTEASDN